MSSVDWKLEIKSMIIPLKVKFTLEEAMKALNKSRHISDLSLILIIYYI
jgi:hypothetical protein